MSSCWQARWASLNVVNAVVLVIIAVLSWACTESEGPSAPAVTLPAIPTRLPEPPAATAAIPTVNGAGSPQPVPTHATDYPSPSPAAVFCDAWEASFDAALEGDAAASSFNAFNHTSAGKAFLAAYNKAAYGKGASEDEACEAAYAVASRIGRMP